MAYKIEQLLKSVFKIVHGDQNILKYLYYPAENGDFDPLASPDVSDADKDKLVRKTDALVELEILTTASVKRGRIGVYLQSTNTTGNPLIPDRRIRIEIYMPIRDFEEYTYRTAYIVSRLDELLLQENISGGFGKLQIESSNNIGVKVNGYTTYYHDYSSGSIKGLSC